MISIREFLRQRRDPVHTLARRQLVPPPRKLIHVGAHLGQERHKYDALGYTDVLWVEGAPSIAARLKDIVAHHGATSRSRHRVVEAIVTDTDGAKSQLLELSNDGASTSLFPLSELGRQRWSLQLTGATQPVPSRTVDSIAGEYDMLDADVLVADVQGAEFLVFKGAQRVLQSARAVISEISQVALYDGGVLLPELTAFLADHGFARAMKPPKRHGDMLFLRR
jgi:FkbM family methyltransferase